MDYQPDVVNGSNDACHIGDNATMIGQANVTYLHALSTNNGHPSVTKSDDVIAAVKSFDQVSALSLCFIFEIFCDNVANVKIITDNIYFVLGKRNMAGHDIKC